MNELGLKEELLEESFIRSSGPGGQKVNKSSTAVLLKDPISGLEIKCQKTRSQGLNRYYARVLLCEKLDEKVNQAKSEIQQEREKIRRQKRKRSRRAKEKVLLDKKKQSEKKQNRKSIRKMDD